jgi:hypothetical protein
MQSSVFSKIFDLKKGEDINERNYVDLIRSSIQVNVDQRQALLECASIVHNYGKNGERITDDLVIKRVVCMFQEGVESECTVGQFPEFWYLVEQICHKTQLGHGESNTGAVLGVISGALRHSNIECDRVLSVLVGLSGNFAFTYVRPAIVAYASFQFFQGHASPKTESPGSRVCSQDLYKAVWQTLAESTGLPILSP